MIYKIIDENRKKGAKILLPLIDPDKFEEEQLKYFENIDKNIVPFILIGGSLISSPIGPVVNSIKKHCNLPVVLYPGSPTHLTKEVDAVFLLSMISGRNPDLLIGHHVVAAPMIKQLNVETIPTGYMLIDGGSPTSVEYISQTQPIPANKNDIAKATAMAGEMLGLKLIYMDAGSGAKWPISTDMISEVRKNIDIPLIIGGGVRDEAQAKRAFTAGADAIIVGTAFEEDSDKIAAIVEMIREINGQ